jgi:excisionase family DNA binding protein
MERQLAPEDDQFVDEETAYLYPGEVARMLHVSPKTVLRWANEAKIPYVKTLGGHRRFPLRAIRELAGKLSTP